LETDPDDFAEVSDFVCKCIFADAPTSALPQPPHRFLPSSFFFFFFVFVQTIFHAGRGVHHPVILSTYAFTVEKEEKKSVLLFLFMFSLSFNLRGDPHTSCKQVFKMRFGHS